MNLCLPYTPCLVHPLWIVTWKVGGPVCHCMCVPVTLVLFLHLVQNVYMHQYMNLCPPGCLCLVHPFGIVIWKDWHPCMAVCLCLSHLISGPRPCLECVHASVHEFMSTWLLMSGPPPMHSLMETWVPLYGSVFVYQSSFFCCHTLFRMCTCISTWIYVYLTPHVWSTPYG